MARSKTYVIAWKSTKQINFLTFYDNNGVKTAVEAYNYSAKIYDMDYNLVAELPVERQQTGLYYVKIDTLALNLQPGEYYLEFLCVVGGNSYARRDKILVSLLEY